MESKRIALLTIAVVAIGIFALPSTMSLFAGQHVWYDLSGKGNEVPCEKCHADVAAEMESLLGPHTGETGYGRMECEYCHRVFPIVNKNASFDTYIYASGNGTGAEPGKEAHAASTVPCMYCHSGEEAGIVTPQAKAWHDNESDCLYCHIDGGSGHGYVHGNAKYFTKEDCYKCHLCKNESESIITIRIPPAGGFGLTTNTLDTGELAAHKAFVMDSINDKTMDDANEACLACHTMIAVKIRWEHARRLEFDVGLDSPVTTETGVHNWTMSNWAVNGTANATVWGNTTGAGNTSYWSEWPGNVDNIYE
jgi:hypothetical protein